MTPAEQIGLCPPLGDWSGNLYDFYFRVYNRLRQDIKNPFPR